MRSTASSLLMLSLVCFLACSDDEAIDSIPSNPVFVAGDTLAEIDASAFVTFSATDPAGSALSFTVDWGDGRALSESDEIRAGIDYTGEHIYIEPGEYRVRCRVRNIAGRQSAWSDPHTIVVHGEARRGRGSWWMFMGNPRHTGRSEYSGPSPIGVFWRFRTGAPVRSGFSFGADGVLYAASDDHHVYAMYSNGNVRWRYAPSTTGISGTPAVMPDGSVVAASNSATVSGVSWRGERLWSVATNGPVELSSPLPLDDGTVVVGCSDGQLYAVDPQRSLRPLLLTSGPITCSPAQGADGSIYVGSGDHVIYALSPAGTLRWTLPTGGPVHSSPSIADDGTIYIGSDDGWLRAVHPDGTLRWKLQLHAPIRSCPAIAEDGRIYVHVMDGILAIVRPDGSLQRGVRLAEYGTPSSPVLDAAGKVYVGSADWHINCLSPGGQLLWQIRTDGPVESTPALGPGGKLYVGSNDGHIYAIH